MNGAASYAPLDPKHGTSYEAALSMRYMQLP